MTSLTGLKLYFMKVTVLSPHIDDAAYGVALSIGDFVRNKLDVTILNCFTYTNWAIRFVSRDLNEIRSLRKNEDVSFYKLYNAPINIVNLEMIDAPLRKGYIFKSEALEKEEIEVVDQLEKHLERIDGLLLCPLAIGDHIDHVICLEAVIRLYSKKDILFFEDMPYAHRICTEEINNHLKKLEKRLNVSLISHIQSMQNCCISKAGAIRLYETQINDQIHDEIITHMNGLGGERVWGEGRLIAILKQSCL